MVLILQIFSVVDESRDFAPELFQQTPEQSLARMFFGNQVVSLEPLVAGVASDFDLVTPLKHVSVAVFFALKGLMATRANLMYFATVLFQMLFKFKNI